MQRSLLIFQNTLKSEETIKAYTWYLNKFKEFYKLKDYDSMITIQPEKLQIMIEDYIMSLKKTKHPNSIPTFFYPIKSFFEASGLELKWKKIIKLFPETIKKSGREAWTTFEIKIMLDVTTNLRTQSILHFLASSGCRVGALPELKRKHVSEIGKGCKSILVYEDSKDEYITFLTPEASNVLDNYLEKRKADGEIIQNDSPLFRAKYLFGKAKVRPITKKGIESSVRRAAKNAGLRDETQKHKGRFPKQLDHGFRKRFTTTLKLNERIPVAITERLAGHKMYYDELGNKIQLDEAYMRATTQQLFEKFKLAIPDLTISDESRQEAKIEKQKQKITDLEKKEYEIEDLKLGMKRLKAKVKRIEKINKI